MKNKTASLALLCAVALLALPSCSTNVQGDDASPVFLSVEFQDSLLTKNVDSGTATQLPTIILRNIVKAPDNGSSDFLDVKVDDYVVEWRRTDGGTIVPQTETFGFGNVIVPSGSTSTLSNFPILTATALQRAPLDQLFPFNGGVDRETHRLEIAVVAIITFRGHTLSGQAVRGAGSVGLIFNFVSLTTATRVAGEK